MVEPIPSAYISCGTPLSIGGSGAQSHSFSLPASCPKKSTAEDMNHEPSMFIAALPSPKSACSASKPFEKNFSRLPPNQPRCT